MGGGGDGYKPPTQQQNQASLDIANGVVQPGSDEYRRAQLARTSFRGAGYRSPTESLLASSTAQDGGSTLLG